MLWTNGISLDLSLRRISDRCPLLHSTPADSQKQNVRLNVTINAMALGDFLC